MISIIKTDAKHRDFLSLVAQLDRELAERDGEDHGFYAQFNNVDAIPYVILAYKEGVPISCGGMKAFGSDTLEIKRMYTHEAFRTKGIASRVLSALEAWALELGYKKCVLETGLKQPEAIRLYQKNDYVLISNYGQYEGVENSRCFEKQLDV